MELILRKTHNEHDVLENVQLALSNPRIHMTPDEELERVEWFRRVLSLIAAEKQHGQESAAP